MWVGWGLGSAASRRDIQMHPKTRALSLLPAHSLAADEAPVISALCNFARQVITGSSLGRAAAACSFPRDKIARAAAGVAII